MFILVILGAAIILLLGVAHAVFTLQSTPTGGPMMPTDVGVREAMSTVGGLGIAPELQTTLYKAWVGFNLSHSLGMVVVGVLIGLPVVMQMSIPTQSTAWLLAALILPWVYLWLSIRYWFAKPTQGIAMASTLISIGTLGELLFF